MDNSARARRAKTLTSIGIAIVFLLTLTKIVPSSKIAGYSVLVGVAFFFIVEAAAKTPEAESGLRFKTFFADLRKRGVLLWMLLPIASAVATLFVGDWMFDGGFSAHVVGRTESMLSFDKLPLLIFQVVVAAMGEEIAFRGFPVGKSMKYCPFLLFM